MMPASNSELGSMPTLPLGARATGIESDNSRTFSLASSPHDNRPVMIAMRMRKTAFKTALKSTALGTKFIVSRPRGSFTLHRDTTRPAVFLAGGIGITPIRSIFQWVTQEHLPHRLYLFYSNRDADDAAFLEEFEIWPRGILSSLSFQR
jgi:ferredoxin-NADP reductase